MDMCDTNVANRSLDSFLADELAPFSMRELSGGERSPSPIESTPNTSLDSPSHFQELSFDSPDAKTSLQADCDISFVSIEDVDACITPRPNSRERQESLETIFEDVLLDTPPRKHQHTSLIRKMVHRKFLEHSPEGYPNNSPDSPTGSPLRKRLKDK
ncbi:uncharacterized protein LOC132261302 [Phlebotomus argentipes]|uniref:uncharacterized protein LOC132261302 n=1 Tax=Phlebotomus argentipes TaxID=94469 RepID=UPI002892C3EC|nr:uncharacterized protein LOC132261302 [Phlebotomus argentipes]